MGENSNMKSLPQFLSVVRPIDMLACGDFLPFSRLPGFNVITNYAPVL